MKLLAIFTLYCTVVLANPVLVSFGNDQDYEASKLDSLSHHQGHDEARGVDILTDDQGYDDADDTRELEIFDELDIFDDDHTEDGDGDDDLDFFDDFDIFDDDQDDDEGDELDIFDDLVQSYNQTGPFDDLDDYHGSNEVRDLAVRANDKNLEAAQRAAGSVKLRSGKSYYFLTCNKLTRRPTALDFKGQGGDARQWVAQSTVWEDSPYGCAHVGLVIGRVKRVGGTKPGCLTCTSPDKTFEAKFFDVVIRDPRTRMWEQREIDWQPKDGQILFFRGEVGKTGKSETVKMDKLYKALKLKGEKWMSEASLVNPDGQRGPAVFNTKYNCLVYYNTLLPLVTAAA